MADLIEIDGSFGEGGGQILRTSLSLSVATGRPLRLTRIRAGRQRPGLLRQHLTAVEAAAAVSGAEVEGAQVGSPELSFTPGAPRAGDYQFKVGTAGSTTLVLQTILPALVLAGGESTVTIDGGTHNPLAPPFEFLERAFLPLLDRMGPRVEIRLDRRGFYPAGGGRITARIQPCRQLQPLELLDRGKLIEQRATAVVANLPEHIAEREIAVVRRQLGWPGQAVTATDSTGPGNVVFLEIRCQNLTEIFTGFGQKGVRAEDVARAAVEEARAYLESGAAVGTHLADQLLLPLALAGSGRFTMMAESSHFVTNREVIRRFLPVEIETVGSGSGGYLCRVSGAGC